MKTLFFTLLTIVLLSCGDDSRIPVGERTSMEVEQVYDAGKVVLGEVITAKFVIKNTGDYPLVFGDIQPSCSCTLAEKPEEPIKPGETGEIMAHVNTDRTGSGAISKTISITANTSPSVTKLIIKAKVVRK